MTGCPSQLHERREIDSTLSAAELGASFVALSDGLQLQWLYNPDGVEPIEILRAFLASVIPALRS